MSAHTHDATGNGRNASQDGRDEESGLPTSKESAPSGRRVLAAMPWAMRCVLGGVAIICVMALLWVLSLFGPLGQSALTQQLSNNVAIAESDAAALTALARTGGTASPSSLVSQLPTDENVRITLVGPDGMVVADSAFDIEGLASHIDRPEVTAALGGRVGTDVRQSHEDATERAYAAAPVELEGQTYALCVSTPTADVRGVLSETRHASIALLLVAIALAIALLVVTIWAAGRPVRRLQQLARNLTSDADERLSVPTAAIGQLAGDLARSADAGDLATTRTLSHHLVDESAALAHTVQGLDALAGLDTPPAIADPPVASSLRQAVHASVASHEGFAHQRGLSLELRDSTDDHDACLVALSGPVAELTVDGLVDNALRYTRAGGVTVRLAADASLVTLAVRDSGIGIADGERERVFERFYRGDAARDLGDVPDAEHGAGLGLALVRQAVLRAGGSVDLESELGHGTTITVRLPRVHAQS